MLGSIDDLREQLDTLKDLPIDDLSEGNVEQLWQRFVADNSSATEQLSEAKMRRAKAEAAREEAVLQALQNTQMVCEQIRRNAEQDLQDAKAIKEEMLGAKQEAETELRWAKEIKRQSTQEAERIVREANEKAQDIISQSRMTADREMKELKQRVLIEVKQVLARAENVSLALKEEIETQKVLSTVARINSEAKQISEGALNKNIAALKNDLKDGASGPIEPIPLREVSEEASDLPAESNHGDNRAGVFEDIVNSLKNVNSEALSD